MEQLVEHLNSYSKHGIPQLHRENEDLEEGKLFIFIFLFSGVTHKSFVTWILAIFFIMWTVKKQYKGVNENASALYRCVSN